MLTHRGLFLVGRETEKSGANKGQSRCVVTRHVTWADLNRLSMSTRQDDFVVVHVNNSHDSLLQIPFKAEFATVAKRLVQNQCNGKDLRIVFADKIEFLAEKSRLTGGKKRIIQFEDGNSNLEAISAPGFLKNELRVAIKRGLPNTSSKFKSNIRNPY